MSKLHTCAWCGTDIEETEGHDSWFCPECQQTYDEEKQLSLHPVEVRMPHND